MYLCVYTHTHTYMHIYVHVNATSYFNTMNCFSLTALNMSWCSLDNECMTALCRTLPSSITRLNIAGCRKTITDESKCDY